MRTLLASLACLSVAVGCSHSPPKVPENYTITETSHECDGNSCRVVTRVLPEREVTVKPIPQQELPRVQGQTDGVILEPPKVTIDVDDNPYEDMEKNETLLKAMKEAVDRDTPCKCQAGDPLCSCL